jgi:hypothetical protein
MVEYCGRSTCRRLDGERRCCSCEGATEAVEVVANEIGC